MTATGATADDIIWMLDLRPHPEGGRYRETFRDVAQVRLTAAGALDPSAGTPRAASTAIYYLLRAGEVSRWHRVDASEVWHWYAGAPLQLIVAAATGGPVVHVLGGDLMAGQRPQVVVPAGDWQQAQSLGAWSLVGCTVAPGFVFSGFEMAPDGFEPGSRA